jgi:S-(hydroxymethyl)glutathione dehydrogenase/alcohol dehydrogenase
MQAEAAICWEQNAEWSVESIDLDPPREGEVLVRMVGATHAYESVEQAFVPIQAETRGRMCDKVICAIGVGQGRLMAPIMALTAKRGRVVVTNMHPMTETDVSLSLCDLTLMEKQIVGSIFGSANIRYDIPHLLDLYRLGQLDLESMVTNRYKLGDINQGYQDMRDGKNIRGVLVYDD